MITVTIDGRTFSDTPSAAGLVLQKIEGWFDGPPVRGKDTSRLAAHGSFGQRAWRGPRVIDVHVAVLTRTPAEAGAAQLWLAALLAEGTFGDLTVVDPAGMRLTSRVRLNAQPLITWAPQSTVVRAVFQFWAPDALRYGEAVSRRTGFPLNVGGLHFPLFTNRRRRVGVLSYGARSTTGRLVLTNPGTAPVWPTFQVAGPVPSQGFDIAAVGTDRRVRFAGTVPAGSVLVIDTGTGTAVLDGNTDRGEPLTIRDWDALSIPAEGSLELAFINLGPYSGAELTAVIRPGWW